MYGKGEGRQSLLTWEFINVFAFGPERAKVQQLRSLNLSESQDIKLLSKMVSQLEKG